MRILSFLSRIGCAAFLVMIIHGQAEAASSVSSATPFLYQNHPIKLLQPLNGSSSVEFNATSGIGIFFDYFNHAWPWVIGSAAGIGVLQALIGGVQIMLSGGKAGKEEGKTRLLWALAGLLMVGLSGLILETLNPLFYNQL